ncbi:hypothetical protein D3C75_458930 [compost metagenome]
MKIFCLSPTEEIVVLLLKIEEEQYRVLFTDGLPYHNKAVKKINKMQKRIIKLGGNVNAKIKVENS